MSRRVGIGAEPGATHVLAAHLQGAQDRAERLVAGGVVHQRTEPVVQAGDLVGVGGLLELIDHRVHLGQLLVGHPLRGERRRRWQQQLAHLDHLVEVLRLDQFHREHHARQQLARSQAGDVRAVAAADVEHVDLRERPDRFAQRAPRDAQSVRQLLFGRQPFTGCQFARADHRPNAVDRLRRDAHHKPPMFRCTDALGGRRHVVASRFAASGESRQLRPKHQMSAHYCGTVNSPLHDQPLLPDLIIRSLAAHDDAPCIYPRRTNRLVRRGSATHQPTDPGPAGAGCRPRDPRSPCCRRTAPRCSRT